MLVLRGALQWHHLVERVAAHHHTAGVGAHALHAALNLARPVDQVMQIGVAIVDLFQLGHAIQRLRNGSANRQRRNKLGNAIDLVERDVEHARHIAQRGLRAQRAIGDDLGYILAAIGIGNILKNFAAPRVSEVGVDIGHFQALAREEALE